MTSKILIVNNNNELLRVSSERIAYIISDGNYCTLVLTDKQERVFAINLSSFQNIIEKQLKAEAQDFIRIGKSLIVNRNYIFYINPSKQQLILSGQNFSDLFDLTASKEALKQLKAVVEETIK